MSNWHVNANLRFEIIPVARNFFKNKENARKARWQTTVKLRQADTVSTEVCYTGN